MKDWKIILANGVITAVLLFAGIKWLIPDVPDLNTDKIEKALSVQIEVLQSKVSSMEQALSEQAAPSGTVLPKQRGAADGTLRRVEQKLDVLLGKIAFLQQKIDTMKPVPGFGNNAAAIPEGDRQSPSRMGGRGRIDWLENLTPEKRSEVDMIFEEHAKLIREKLPVSSDGSPPDRETMRQVLRESDEELRETLKEVLSEEEYQQFLNSLPKRRPLLPGNGGPGQGLGGLR